MDRYYTPSIEEFHFGFEYEQIPDFTDGTVKTQEQFKRGIFEKRIFNVGDGPYIWRALTGKNAHNGRCGIRVKYLDTEDFLEFGFSLERVYKEEEKDLFQKDNIRILYNYDTHRVSIFSADPSRSDYFMKLNVDPYAVNFITIKNKSELLVLLKQLNILK